MEVTTLVLLARMLIPEFFCLQEWWSFSHPIGSFLDLCMSSYWVNGLVVLKNEEAGRSC